MQLTEISVQPVEQKIAFWQTLYTNYLQNYQHQPASSINESLAVYKILPLITTSLTQICSSESMLSQDLYRREVMAMLGPLFFVAEQFLVPKSSTTTATPDSGVTAFQQHVGPLIALLFNVNDRGVRGVLLQKATLLSQQLDKNALNSSVFEPMCGGFSDSSAALRELTLKATLGMVPRLTPPNLEKLSRYLQRLQTDPEASIRTNTVIFVSKLAPHLGEVSRQKLLLPAYARAMKDVFPPCRLAALQATLRSKEFFTAEDVANKVLPAVMPQLLDSMADVRKEAFSIVDALLVVLRDESARMNMRDAETASSVTQGATFAPGVNTMSSGGSVAPAATKPTVTTTPPQPLAAPSSGGYFGGISSWMGSSTAKPTPAATSATSSVPPATSTPLVSAAPIMNATPQNTQQFPVFSTLSLSDAGLGAGSPMNHQMSDDGWGDDDEDLLGLGHNSFGNTQAPIASAATSAFKTGSMNTNEDFFSSGFDNTGMNTLLGAAMAKRPQGVGASSGKLIMPKPRISTASKPVAAAATKLQLDKEDTNWDDF
jgi:SCY1-like protein 1